MNTPKLGPLKGRHLWSNLSGARGAGQSRPGIGAGKQEEVKMKKSVFLGALTVAGLAAGALYQTDGTGAAPLNAAGIVIVVQ